MIGEVPILVMALLSFIASLTQLVSNITSSSLFILLVHVALAG